jgi:hypothetical protein
VTKHRDEGDDATADDPVMRSMRSVWLTMRDEDPPQRGMAELLAAARVQAEAMQPKASWWRRTLAVMWRPPVLALATAVVLVGGALVVNNRNKDLEVATTQETPRLDSLETPPAPSERDTASVPPAEPAGTAPGAPDPSSTIVTEAPRVPPRTTRGARPVAPPAPPLPPPQDDHGEVGGRAASANVKLEADKPSPKPAASEQDGLLIAGESSPDTTADVAASPVRPQSTVAATRTGPPRTELVEQLVKQTEVAAGRKDCPAVRATAARVKKLDANVYKARVAKQPAIATCLQ